MTQPPFLPAASLVAIDIGNSRIKVGSFPAAPGCAMADEATPLPIVPPAPVGGVIAEPADVWAFAPTDASGEPERFEGLIAWLTQHAPSGTPIVVGSVNPATTERLLAALAPRNGVRVLVSRDMPIANLTLYPERVGIDRLAAAVGANPLRRPETPAIVVDFGTAITVDLVTAEGEFAGGAILPGLRMQARSLHQGTASLPEITLELEGANSPDAAGPGVPLGSRSPAAVGTSTEGAIAAGIYWGGVGAVRELIARQSDRLVRRPQVFVTGSTSPEMARLLGSPEVAVRYIPHLVLSGLALAAGLPGERGQ